MMFNKKSAGALGMVLLFVFGVALAEIYTPEPSNRVKINLGATPWKFISGDVSGADGVAFNDGAWQTVGIPYHWGDMLSFLNDGTGGPGNGYYATVWYRKHFTLDNAYAGRKVFVEFEGASVGAQVYINGSFIPSNSKENPKATHVIGFVPFIVDITSKVNFGADNVLAVKVSNNDAFYTYPHYCVDFKYGMGAGGLFRPVYMHITDKVYVPANVYSVVNNWGTYVSTISANTTAASVKILTHVKNEGGDVANVTLTTKVVDATKNVVWTEDKTQSIAKDSAFVFDQTATISNPHLWYPNNSIYGTPYMHKVYHIVKMNGKTVDVFETPLGIRVITWGPHYPIINGHEHSTWGAASRYDYPALGCAVPEEVQWHDAKLLAECGGSLWRPGHATSSPEFVAACDAYGIMLMQPSGDIEGSFMTSQIAKTAPWDSCYNARLKYETHREMLVRDRNNPSILAWEVSNGPIDLEFSRAIRKNLDSIWDPVNTRAMSDRGYGLALPSFQAGIASIISCSGAGCAGGFATSNPTVPTWGAEEWGAKAARADYEGELGFANAYIKIWKEYKLSKVFGLAHWYMAETPGESGLGRCFGASMMDWNRIPKMLYHCYTAIWNNYSLKPVVRLAHHWNRSGSVQVNAFSNCPSVRLWVNTTDYGTKTPFPDSTTDNSMMPRQCTWTVNWAAGTLRAEGLDASGNVVCFDEKKTAGPASKIALSLENGFLKPDGQAFKIYANGSDAAIILATVTDANGNWCPTATNTVTFGVSGPGDYRGGAENYAGSHVPGNKDLTAEGGFCKVAVRSTFTPGTVTVSAQSAGLESANISFTSVEVSPVISAVQREAFHPAGTIGLPVIKTLEIGNSIRYHVNQEITMSVELLNAAGKVVKRTSLKRHSAGWHTLGAENVSPNAPAGSGIYFIRFVSDKGFKLVKRLALVK
jgi:beta-galactosidase